MAFTKQNTASTSKNRNQFVAQMVSTTTGDQAGFFNMSDVMARKSFGVRSVADVTYEQALEKLPLILNSHYLEVVVTNPEAELVTKDITQF